MNRAGVKNQMTRKSTSNLIDLTCTDSDDDNNKNSQQTTNNQSIPSNTASFTPSSSSNNNALFNTILINGNGIDDTIFLHSDPPQLSSPQTRKRMLKRHLTAITPVTSEQSQDLRFLKSVQNTSVGKVLKPQARPAKKAQAHQPVVILVPDTPIAPPTPTLPQSRPQTIPSQTSEKKCPICLDPLVRASVTLCGHVYCTECILNVVKSTKQCPICRKKLSQRGFHPIYM